ncbi:MAG: hypothetical protein R3Y24_04385 [Eubacteriales bacterium]
MVIEMDVRALALCELSNDLLYHKIEKDKLSQYVDLPLAKGKEIAQKFAGQDIEELYKEYGIKIKYSKSGKKSYGVILRGQVTMSKSECEVEIYTESIEQLAKFSHWNGISLTYEEALHVHLAHEFYHFWEYKNKISILDDLPKVERFSFLGMKKYCKINRGCEVAAHAFAMELLGLPTLPSYYDYMYLMQTGNMKEEDFQSLIKKMQDLLGE